MTTGTIESSARAVPWYLAAVVLVLFDGVASAAVIAVPEGEANPLLRALMAELGIVPALVLRVVVGAALLSVLLALASRHRCARQGLVLVGVVHAAVGMWHLIGPAVVAGSA